jgi:hypothetical protein
MNLQLSDINIVETKKLTDRQTMEQVRLIYVKRKGQDRMYSIRRLAVEIGLGEAVTYAALIRKIASQKTLQILRKYLMVNKNGVFNVEKH